MTTKFIWCLQLKGRAHDCGSCIWRFESAQTHLRKVFCDWTGKKHREDTKKKIGEINSIKQKGERNSQFGTCWITNGTIDKKIMKYDLHLFEGWSMGRSYWKMNKIK